MRGRRRAGQARAPQPERVDQGAASRGTSIDARRGARAACGPGDTIVEAQLAATPATRWRWSPPCKGYRMVVVMPTGLSRSARRSRGRSAPRSSRPGTSTSATRATSPARLGERPGWFAPGQFDSEWNVDENATWLGPEILRAARRARSVPDAVVCGIGTGGTLVGVGRAFRAVNPDCAVIGVEPHESCTLCCGEVGRHRIEGIADGFVPGHRRPPPRRDRRDRHRRLRGRARRDAPAGARESACSSARAPGRIWSPPGAWLAAHPGATVVTLLPATRARSTSPTTSAMRRA